MKSPALSITEPVKIGTRGSPLALYQARLVQSLLAKAAGVAIEDKDTAFPIVILTTTGDKLKGELAPFGGKGLFTKELETALLDSHIDLAVHSMKDVATVGHKDLIIAALLPREDPRDAFISPHAKSLLDLPQGAVIGTASIRRRAQVARLRPDIRFSLLRGNVGTRLEKLESGQCEATFLAAAGLHRLDQAHVITDYVSADQMLNAPAQGVIGVEIRKNNDALRALVAMLNDANAELAITIERAFLQALDGSCRTPIAALAEPREAGMYFRGQVLSKDGDLFFSCQGQLTSRSVMDGFEFGLEHGKAIRAEIGERILWDD